MAIPPLMVAMGALEEVLLGPSHVVLLSRALSRRGSVTSHLPGKRHIVREESVGHWVRRAVAAACKVRRGRDALVPGLLSLPLGSTNRSQLVSTDGVEPDAMRVVSVRHNVKNRIAVLVETSRCGTLHAV